MSLGTNIERPICAQLQAKTNPVKKIPDLSAQQLFKFKYNSSSSDSSAEVEFDDEGLQHQDSSDDELCVICGEYGKGRETWFRCTSCGKWAHKDCSGVDKPTCYKARFSINTDKQGFLLEDNVVEVGSSNEEWVKPVTHEATGNMLTLTFKDFVQTDDDVATAEEYTDDNFVQNCVSTCASGNNSEDEAD
ncbi:hypothetical protein RN001_008939 [Aquatica leii]|uniref:Uncharacterized protein n=1 Tax=Aquatica leii TaxID=1421715 RepID=A0AAN7PB97_9COLE|nr:hypothetical protein RN001_008939 [Aquatica leii]